MIEVRVEYVDGSVAEAEISDWPSLPAQGVNTVLVSFPGGGILMQGSSLYWIAREDDSWRIGQAPVGYAPLPPETLVSDDGSNGTRVLDYLPDISHCDLKLGWWMPGTEGNVIVDG